MIIEWDEKRENYRISTDGGLTYRSLNRAEGEAALDAWFARKRREDMWMGAVLLAVVILIVVIKSSR